MAEKFIEKGTSFPLKNGKLTIYETNCACKQIQFFFEQYVFTLMLSGHKTINSEHLKFEFFPGTFFIPEKGTINNVSIPNASIYNPTKCLVLELNPSFIQSVYQEILYSDFKQDILSEGQQSPAKPFFVSNDRLLIQAFTKLYELQSLDKSPSKILIEELVIKEMLFRLFNTECLQLIKSNFEQSIPDEKIRRVIRHIKSNIGDKLTTASLAHIADLGKTTFFNLFKSCTQQSPIDYVLNERIRQAKILIERDKHSLQEIAFKCGFNSYEYFCRSFKKIENTKPTDFKKTKSLALQF